VTTDAICLPTTRLRRRDPRVIEVLCSLARHLQDFTKEAHLPRAKWRKALVAIEWAAKITTSKRNEFVLWSDRMGLSSLVDMVNSQEGATRFSGLAPFQGSNVPPLAIGGDMRKDFDAEVLLVTEVLPDDDPYLDQDTVFGVRKDLVMTWSEQPADSFPTAGFVLSAKVDGRFFPVDFDFVRMADHAALTARSKAPV
jgi:hypothetical protein